MENTTSGGAVVGRRSDLPLERGRKGHRQPRGRAAAKTAKSGAFLQALSCSDDVRGSAGDPAQSADIAGTAGGVRERRNAGGIAARSGKDLSVYRGNHGARPQ